MGVGKWIRRRGKSPSPASPPRAAAPLALAARGAFNWRSKYPSAKHLGEAEELFAQWAAGLISSREGGSGVTAQKVQRAPRAPKLRKAQPAHGAKPVRRELRSNKGFGATLALLVPPARKDLMASQRRDVGGDHRARAAMDELNPHLARGHDERPQALPVRPADPRWRRAGDVTGSPHRMSAQLLAVLPQRDRGLWSTAMYGGLRRGELMALRIETWTSGRG